MGGDDIIEARWAGRGVGANAKRGQPIPGVLERWPMGGR